MKSFPIYDNYDTNKPIGFVEIREDISEELLHDCVIGPQIKLEATGNKLICYGIFPREQVDTRPRS